MLDREFSWGYAMRNRILQKTSHNGSYYSLDLVDDTSMGAYKYFRDKPFTIQEYMERSKLSNRSAMKRLRAAVECGRLVRERVGKVYYYRVVKLMGNEIR